MYLLYWQVPFKKYFAHTSLTFPYFSLPLSLGTREEMDIIEKTYTEKRLNTILEEQEESPDLAAEVYVEVESHQHQPSERQEPTEEEEEESHKRALEEPMDSSSPMKKTKREGL